MQLRIMTYNIKSGRFHADALDAIARVIEAQSPDVLGLQEVDEGTTRTTPSAQTDWLTRRLRMHGLFAPAMDLHGGQYGIALLSRFPIEAHERRLLYRPNYPDAAQRPRHDSEQRVMLGAIITGIGDREKGNCAFKVIVTHLGLTPDQRTVQIREMADFAAAWHGDLPTVIMGDFNCLPDAPELEPLRARFYEACAARGVRGEDRFTFPSGPRGTRTGDGWRGAI
ncbi:MAG: endonuclease/exonuclease/phosphatase family protein, partial [Chloroflexi bacterium]|nr:endonuclease/exonuclease/phosphatase family protein [Chloroflexota bacterium]